MKKITLFLLDLIALYASLIITLFIRYRSNTKEFNALFEPHLISFSVIFIVWLVVFYIAGLYDQRNFRNTAQFYSGFFRTISVAGAVSVIFFYLIPIFGITPKTNLFIFIVIFTLLESANRYLFNNVILIGVGPVQFHFLAVVGHGKGRGLFRCFPGIIAAGCSLQQTAIF